MAPGWIRTDLGGPGATFSVEEAIPQVVDVLLSQQGKPGLQFLDREGRTVPGDRSRGERRVRGAVENTRQSSRGLRRWPWSEAVRQTASGSNTSSSLQALEPQVRSRILADQRKGALPVRVATLEASADALLVSIETDDKEAVERLKEIVAKSSRPVRVSRRPLQFKWSATEDRCTRIVQETPCHPTRSIRWTWLAQRLPAATLDARKVRPTRFG